MRSRSSIDGQALELLVEAGILHRDPGVERERLDEGLVVLGEFGRVDLVGQVEVAERDALDRDRDAEEAGHRRVVGREARAARVGADVGDPERAVLADDQPEQAAALAAAARSAARVASSMPLVMNRSMRPVASTMPSAA